MIIENLLSAVYKKSVFTSNFCEMCLATRQVSDVLKLSGGIESVVAETISDHSDQTDEVASYWARTRKSYFVPDINSVTNCDVNDVVMDVHEFNP